MQVRTAEMDHDFDLLVGDDGEVVAVVVRAGLLPRRRLYELGDLLGPVRGRVEPEPEPGPGV
jgi:hypothetical protein